MPLKLFRKFRSFDWFLIINILLLIFFGLSALYSLQFNTADPDFTLFKKQVIFVIIGLILFFLVSFVNHHFWGDYYKVIIIISFLVLLLVLSLGVTLGGARGWFEIGGTTIQPVELVKIALVIF
ncbi:FtsW/RodA/SpoVE family cell cycle protein, partial [bacterium]|nr:FtsW/RodA/SpoVE family cell cycle protein [bacterium]